MVSAIPFLKFAPVYIAIAARLSRESLAALPSLPVSLCLLQAELEKGYQAAVCQMTWVLALQTYRRYYLSTRAKL